MRPWGEGFHQELREVLHDGQLDMFDTMGVAVPYRPGVRCKKCALPWDGQDGRASYAKAVRRGCWFIANNRAYCPACLVEKEAK